MKILMIFILLLLPIGYVQAQETSSGQSDTLAHNWSFGILYTPVSPEQVYLVYYPYYYDYYGPFRPDMMSYPYPETYVSENTEPQMEAQLTIRHPRYNRVRVTLDFSYTRTYTRDVSAEHRVYPAASSYYDNGNRNIDDLKLFRISIGFKYYFSALRVQKVSPYLVAGGGKQMAFVTHRDENMYPDPGVTETDNSEDYLKELNSPFHLYVGFGAEYPFNKSLSLFALVRFYYSWADSKYDYRYLSDTYVVTRTTDSDVADLVKRVGLGLNFYF